ncbi:hypothetical protein N7510_009014 [Penicillium lagena]|uniref:uncharacterized protein n=1 Tax=Penicillium lagena TaxID=94218 RepID=UPI0025412A51|nr:uncharacterized protein N7510_009014 [Penicillium lagena]KAJ5606233.1 hypothetical protein N7510_009014 [Penicillium lagena]
MMAEHNARVEDTRLIVDWHGGDHLVRRGNNYFPGGTGQISCWSIYNGSSLRVSLSLTHYSIAIDTIIMSLNEVWEAASTSPFHPLIPKSSQATFGFNCLLIALVATCMFGLSEFP